MKKVDNFQKYRDGILIVTGCSLAPKFSIPSTLSVNYFTFKVSCKWRKLFKTADFLTINIHYKHPNNCSMLNKNWRLPVSCVCYGQQNDAAEPLVVVVQGTSARGLLQCHMLAIDGANAVGPLPTASLRRWETEGVAAQVGCTKLRTPRR